MTFSSHEKAELRYLDGRVEIIKPGSFVVCAITGEIILLENLRYWNVDTQEPYASPEVALARHQALKQSRS